MRTQGTKQKSDLQVLRAGSKFESHPIEKELKGDKAGCNKRRLALEFYTRQIIPLSI